MPSYSVNFKWSTPGPLKGVEKVLIAPPLMGLQGTVSPVVAFNHSTAKFPAASFRLSINSPKFPP